LIENAEDGFEEHVLRQDLQNIDTRREINLLEAALNLTVSQINQSKSGHKDFANKTMGLLKNVMKIYKKQLSVENSTSAGDSTIDDVTVEQESTTPIPVGSTLAPETCTSPKKVVPSMVNCSASSTFSRKWGCSKAFDGILQTSREGSAWASRGEGVGAWIQAEFNTPVTIKKIKILQRFYGIEANKEIEISFDGDLTQNAVLPATGSRHWNVIKLSRGVLTKSLKISITEVYGTVNNGFKEIAVIGCY